MIVEGDAANKKGLVTQVIGPVVDIRFEADEAGKIQLPHIHDAVEVNRPDGSILILEVQQHIGENTVRTIAMDTTDGLRRGVEAFATYSAIRVPAGDQVKGRLLNVVGKPIDGMKPLDYQDCLPIHREPPKFEDLNTKQEVLSA